MAKKFPEDKYNLEVGQMKSLADFEGDSYSGILIKRNQSGYSYFIKYRDENQKVKRELVSEPNMTKGKAKSALENRRADIKKIKQAIKNGEAYSPSLNKKSSLNTLNEMAEFYFDTHITKTSEKERTRFAFHLKDEEFANKPLVLITMEELNDFRTKLENKRPHNIRRTEMAGKVSNYKNEKLSPKSVSSIIALCKTIVFYAIKKAKYKGENTLQYWEKPKVDNVRLKMMTDKEIELYLESLQEADIRYPRDRKEFEERPYRISYLFALLALTTGARRQTILHIKIKDINFENKTISLYNRKSERPYLGHIVSDKVEEVIKEIIQNNGHPDREYLFCVKNSRTRYGNYPNPVKAKLDEVINKHREGDSILTVRDFRNVFATTLIHKGVNLSFIQNLLSHKTPTMTARYAQMMSSAGGDEVKSVMGGLNL